MSAIVHEDFQLFILISSPDTYTFI